MEFSSYQETLLRKRQILIYGRIDEVIEEYIVKAILLLNASSTRRTITIFINSRGGEVHPNKHIVDVVENSTAPTHGIVLGRAFSSAFNILQVCTRRIAYQNADLMYHASDMAGVRVDDRKSRGRMIKEMAATHEEFLKYLSERSGQPVERWRRWSLTQEYFTGRQAILLGILDEVIRPRKDFPEVLET